MRETPLWAGFSGGLDTFSWIIIHARIARRAPNPRHDQTRARPAAAQWLLFHPAAPPIPGMPNRALVLLLPSGSSSPPPPPTAPPGETRTELVIKPAGKVDLLFMVDNSPSMAPKRAELRKRFPDLVQAMMGGAGQ